MASVSAPAALTALAALLLSSPAAAQDVTAAATAFTAGQQAELNREWGRAAEFYELADQIAPSPQALRSAAKSRVAAGDRAVAATEAEELLRRYPDDPTSSALARGIVEQAAARLTRLDVQCKPACTMSIDRVAVSTEPRGEHVVYVDPGEHRLEAFFAGSRNATKTVTGVEGGQQKLSFEPAAKAPSVEVGAGAGTSLAPSIEHRSESSAGLPPAVAITGMAVTAVLGGIALWSGLETLKAHDEATQAQSKYSSGQYFDGVDLEHRTNWLIGATAAVGVATLGVSLFATRWSSGKSAGQAATELPPVAVVAHPQGGGVVWQGSF